MYASALLSGQRSTATHEEVAVAFFVIFFAHLQIQPQPVGPLQGEIVTMERLQFATVGQVQNNSINIDIGKKFSYPDWPLPLYLENRSPDTVSVLPFNGWVSLAVPLDFSGLSGIVSHTETGSG